MTKLVLNARHVGFAESLYNLLYLYFLFPYFSLQGSLGGCKPALGIELNDIFKLNPKENVA